jgi:hypothetical protein
MVVSVGNFANFTKTQPQYNSSHAVPHVAFMTMLPVGSFIVTACQQIVRIINVDDAGLIVGNLFCPIQAAPTFPVPVHPLIRGLNDRELVQTLNKVTFHSHEVFDLVFIYSLEGLIDGGFAIHGINNAYVIRYYLDTHDFEPSLVPLCPSSHFPFPSHSPSASFLGECYSSRVWTSLMLVQDEFRRILSRVGSAVQGVWCIKTSILPYFSADCWNYICLRHSQLE